jgi:hypothetical protein
VIQVMMCERCKSKPVINLRVSFEGASRRLCPDCVHAFALWFHGARATRTGPYESGVAS